MHTHSMASGLAIARLVEDAPADLAQEAAAYVERARVKLALDNSALVAALMFAQPLIKMWVPHWKFGYTIGLSIGIKFTTDGFYIADIIEHFTNEFTLECLKKGERVAIQHIDWAYMNSRWRNFRNALVNVALEEPLPAARPAASVPRVLGVPDEPEPHVLIVDDAPLVHELHHWLVRQVRPHAKIHSVSSVDEAKKYCKESDASGDYVHLILLDFNLSLTGEDGASTQSLTEVFGSLNGFHVAAALDEMEATSAPAPTTFRYKPFVAMVSYLANSVMDEALATGEMKQDGSFNGCDVLLPKPLNVDVVRTLIEGCGV